MKGSRDMTLSKALTLFTLALVVGCSTPSAKPITDASPALSAWPEASATTLNYERPEAEAAPPEPEIPKPPPQDTRTPLQIAQAACARSDGKWACPKIARPSLMATSGQATPTPAVLTITNWYIDPQNTTTCAADTNSCTSATCGASGIGPCISYGQITQRYGTTIPNIPYGQSVTISFLSAQPAGVDPIFGEYNISGGGQAIITGQPGWVAAGANFTAGALGGGFGYVGATPSAGGTAMTMATVPTYVVKGVLLFNSTRNSYAFVDAKSGTTATLTQPQTSASLLQTATAPVPVVDNDWVAGDLITPWVLPSINLKRWSPKGGDATASNMLTAGYVFGVSVADPSGTGASLYIFENHSANNVMALDLFPARVHAWSVGGRGNGQYLNGCLIETAAVGTSQALRFYGGSVTSYTADGGTSLLSNNTLLHGTTLVIGQTQVGPASVFSDGVVSIQATTFVAAATFWGSYAVNLVAGNSSYANLTGSTFAASALLTTGALTIGSASTACTSPVSGTFVANGATQVGVTGAFATNAFPATAPIYFSLATIGGTPVGQPYFSQAQIQNEFFVKAAAGDTSTYNWSAGSVCGIPITQANLDSATGYNGLKDNNIQSAFVNTR
jgi:hypothetical protein